MIWGLGIVSKMEVCPQLPKTGPGKDSGQCRNTQSLDPMLFSRGTRCTKVAITNPRKASISPAVVSTHPATPRCSAWICLLNNQVRWVDLCEKICWGSIIGQGNCRPKLMGEVWVGSWWVVCGPQLVCSFHGFSLPFSAANRAAFLLSRPSVLPDTLALSPCRSWTLR